MPDFDDIAKSRRGVGEHGALARQEELLRLRGAAAVAEHTFRSEVGELLEVLHEDRRVELQLDIGACHAVIIAGVGEVVPGGEVLEVDPGEPRRRIAAGRCARCYDPAGRPPHVWPGLGRIVRIEAGAPYTSLL